MNSHEEEFEVKTGSTVQYRLKYTTPEEIVAENIGSFSKKESKLELKKMQSASSSLFELMITVPSGNLFTQNKSPKTEQVEYYSIHFKNTVKAVTNELDTVNCSNCIFQASAGFGNNSYFEIEFPGKLETIRTVLFYPKYIEDSIVIMDLSSLQHAYPKLRIK